MTNINELRRLAQAATPGGWYVEHGNYVYGCKDVTDGEEEWHPVIACTDDDEPVNFEANAAFIAAANPATILELLDHLEAAEKERDWHAERCEDAMNECDALRAMIERMEQQGPVEWQTRTRPAWNDGTWGPWRKCSEEYAEDIKKTPLLHDWLYEARALYALPGAKALLRVPDAVMAALDSLDDYIARIEGNDRGACNHINLLRRYLLDAADVGENK